MKKLFLAASAAAVMMASAAVAADLPSRKQAPAAPAPAPTFNWSGFYAGLNAGAAWTNRHGGQAAFAARPDFGDAPVQAAVDAVAREAKTGFTGGAQIGYTHQFGQFVLGGELDYNWTNSGRSAAFGAGLSVTEPFFGSEVRQTYGAAGAARSKLTSFGTLRARLGVLATPQFLLYATGGAAAGQIRNSAAFDAWADIDIDGVHVDRAEMSAAARKTRTRWGWTLGGGAEYAVTPNWSVKAEYLYVDLGDHNHVIATAANDGVDAAIRQKHRMHVVRAGLNYRF